MGKLVATVDLNGNGTIEFDEFCWMMYEMSRTDGEGALSSLQGRIPMAASKDADRDDDRMSVGAKSLPDADEARVISKDVEEDASQPSQSRPQTAGLLLDLESLSRQLAKDTGHGLIDQMGKEIVAPDESTVNSTVGNQ